MVALPANREKGRDRQVGQGLSNVGEMAAPISSESRNQSARNRGGLQPLGVDMKGRGGGRQPRTRALG